MSKMNRANFIRAQGGNYFITDVELDERHKEAMEQATINVIRKKQLEKNRG